MGELIDNRRKMCKSEKDMVDSTIKKGCQLHYCTQCINYRIRWILGVHIGNRQRGLCWASLLAALFRCKHVWKERASCDIIGGFIPRLLVLNENCRKRRQKKKKEVFDRINNKHTISMGACSQWWYWFKISFKKFVEHYFKTYCSYAMYAKALHYKPITHTWLQHSSYVTLLPGLACFKTM